MHVCVSQGETLIEGPRDQHQVNVSAYKAAYLKSIFLETELVGRAPTLTDIGELEDL